MNENAAERGRKALVGWLEDQPTNWFEADLCLTGHLERHWGEAHYEALAPSLDEHGRICAQVLDPLVVQMERPHNLPQLDRWDAVGRRTEEVAFDGRYHEVGKALYGSGVVSVLGERGAVLQSAAILYLSNQLGEAGHNCPIVCTAGLTRALREAGSDELKARYLPGLLSRDYAEHLHGAQFMTEVQGGSDVGANAVIATPVEGSDDQFEITGEKWFCSNCTADIFLMTARIDGGREGDSGDGSSGGTRGLALFLVPRKLPDGTLNHFGIRRLKEKLGTRAMASGEMDFSGAIGWSLGPVESGFKTMMNHVINTSRLYNASGCLAMARRAFVIGQSYARRRGAFGQEIVNYPLVQETLADMRSETEVLLAGHLHLAAVRDRLDLGTAADDEDGFYRVALNLNKYRTCVSSGEVIRSAIELLGGNGAIESFSVLPRLLRDNIVYENWEGTHNTLAMQVNRDMSRLGVGQAFLGNLGARFATLRGGAADRWATLGQAEVALLDGQLQELSGCSAELAGLRMRPLCDRMSWLMAACAAAEHVAWLDGRGQASHGVLAHFWRRRLDPPVRLPDAAYLETLRTLSGAAGLE